MYIKALRIKAVLFDFDGTLTLPGALDFASIRQTLGCPPGQPVLEFIDGLPDDRMKNKAHRQLDAFETRAAAASLPAPGAGRLVAFLRSHAIAVGILTRNSLAAVESALANFDTLEVDDFDTIITRDDAIAVKPDPAGIHLAAERFGVAPSQMLVVGDYKFDIQAGQAAGAPTILIRHDSADSAGMAPADPTGSGWDADFSVTTLEAIEAVVREGLGLPAGKLPNDLLAELLDTFDINDPAVLICPGIGEDTVAIDIAEKEVLVLKSDPITFATDAIGRYAVLVNANDIATSGASPRWLLTTLLFPVGSTPSEIGTTLRDLTGACSEWGITLCGGHTEITDAVTRPVVSGMLAGTVPAKDLIDKRNIRSGDQILLTKGAGVEGTSIIARELADLLLEKGLSRQEITDCRDFLSLVSILPEAGIAARHGGVCGMHDVTEGGIATAITELGIAGGCRLHIDMDTIPVSDKTRRICEVLGVDPLGLIGSGSLLICCRRESCDALVQVIREAGIQIARIGEVRGAGQGVEAVREKLPCDWPTFEVDEIARLFSSL